MDVGRAAHVLLARVAIGGIILSTLVTLVLVPVFYEQLERVRGWTKSLARSSHPERVTNLAS